MPYYGRIHSAINSVMDFMVPTQKTNLALLVSAILLKQSLCLSELARAYPIPANRRVQPPKHCLLHRLKRLWRFTDNERVESLEVQVALIPYTLCRLGCPRLVGLAIDWTMFDTTLPSGKKMRYQVLRIAIPRKGRALPLMQLAYDRDDLPADKSQNQLEQEALVAVIEALPHGVRPVVLADRGFHRASFIRFLQSHGLDYGAGLAPPRRTLQHWEPEVPKRRSECQGQHRNIHQSSGQKLSASTAPWRGLSPRQLAS